MQSCRTEEILLLQSQLLPLEHVVVGVENTGDVLRDVPVEDGLDVVSGVEDLQVEAVRTLGRPESERVADVVLVAGDGVVVGDGQHHLAVDPLPPALRCPHHLPVEVDRDGVLRPLPLPGVAVDQPVVRLLTLNRNCQDDTAGLTSHSHLLVVDDLLSEDPVLVPDAVAVARHTQGGHAVKEAGCQSTQPAIPQTCVRLVVLHLLDIKAQLKEAFYFLVKQLNHSFSSGKLSVF